MRPVDLLIVGYLLLTGVLILGFPKHIPFWALHVAVRLVAVVVVVRLAATRSRNPIVRAVRDWYPILAFIPLYAELNSLTNLFTTVRHDEWVVAWEAALFGGQPSQTLRLAWPQPGISEYLHFAYFFYYFVPTTLALSLSIQRDRARFSEALTAIVLVFLACCMIFVIFPVVGPYHHFGHPPASSWPGFFGPLVHAIVDRGSSLGTAFPSSHTAVAVCVWLTAWRLHRPAFWLLTAIVPALAVGTVYGGFHYAVDTIAGVLLGAVCALATPRLHEGLLARIGGKAAPEPRLTFASQGRGRSLE
ncbi:MAG: phosphatase PAP2 family protein [Candidatus Eiseniibacteriota bacterium]